LVNPALFSCPSFVCPLCIDCLGPTLC
jgi:hypothetical protein